MHNLEKKLRKLRVWTEFHREFKKRKGRTLDRDAELDKYGQKDNHIMWCFVWENSKRGHNYWSDIDNKIRRV